MPQIVTPEHLVNTLPLSVGKVRQTAIIHSQPTTERQTVNTLRLLVIIPKRQVHIAQCLETVAQRVV